MSESVTVEVPQESETETPDVVDSGDTIVVASGESSEVAREVGEHDAEIEQLKAENQELRSRLETLEIVTPTLSEVVEVAEEVAAEVAAPVAEEVSEATVEEVAEEVAAEAEANDSEPGGTHWLFRSKSEWRNRR